MAGELNLKITLHRPAYPVIQSPQQAYILIEAMPSGLLPAAHQQVNFCLVMDRSGSMAGDKLKNLKEAAKMVVDRLGADDVLSIVIFDESADVIIASQNVTDPVVIKQKIDGIQERGGTKMSTGLQAGLAEVQKGLTAGRVNRILLLTDGRTWEDQTACEQLADQARTLGVPLSVMGMGVGAEGDWDPRFLEALAQRSGGEWYIIDTPAKVSNFFDTTLKGMQGTAVTNAQITLRLASEVHPKVVWRVIPLIARLDHRSVSDRDVQVFLGDIQFEVGQSLMAEVLLPVRQPGSYRLLQADITYDVPATNEKGQTVKADVVVVYTNDPALPNQVDARIMNLVERVTAHKLQTQALDEAAAGQIPIATQRLRAAATRLLEIGETGMAQDALAQADRLEQGSGLDPAVTQQLRYQTKRLTENLGPAAEEPPPAVPVDPNAGPQGPVVP